jgi:hypothetical protein
MSEWLFAAFFPSFTWSTATLAGKNRNNRPSFPVHCHNGGVFPTPLILSLCSLPLSLPKLLYFLGFFFFF